MKSLVWILIVCESDVIPAKVNTNFADKRRSLGRYFSLAEAMELSIFLESEVIWTKLATFMCPVHKPHDISISCDELS
jgi:hypothetical protein